MLRSHNAPGFRWGCDCLAAVRVGAIGRIELSGTGCHRGKLIASAVELFDVLIQVCEVSLEEFYDVFAGAGAFFPHVENRSDLCEGESCGLGVADEIPAGPLTHRGNRDSHWRRAAAREGGRSPRSSGSSWPKRRLVRRVPRSSRSQSIPRRSIRQEGLCRCVGRVWESTPGFRQADSVGKRDLTFQSNGRCTLTVRSTKRTQRETGTIGHDSVCYPMWLRPRDDFDVAETRLSEFVANRSETAKRDLRRGRANAARQSGVTNVSNEERADA